MSAIARLRDGFHRAFSLSATTTNARTNGSASRRSVAEQIRDMASSIDDRFDSLDTRLSGSARLLSTFDELQQSLSQLQDDHSRLTEITKSNVARASASTEEQLDLLRSLRDIVGQNKEQLSSMKRSVVESNAAVADIVQDLSSMRESQSQLTDQIKGFVERLTQQSDLLDRKVWDMQEEVRRLRWWATGAFITCGAIAVGALVTLLIVLS